jgi:hypothetical protein
MHYDTGQFLQFTKVRSQFETFLITNRSITEAVRKLGSGRRSRPRVLSLYRTILKGFQNGQTVDTLLEDVSKSKEFGFLFAESAPETEAEDTGGRRFAREVKGGAYLRDALPTAPKCPICGGLMHHNGMQAAHLIHKRDGGSGSLSNAVMQHPFCNSTVQQ